MSQTLRVGEGGVAARGWRVVATTSGTRFAWDVLRLRFLSGNDEETGLPIDSAHSGESCRPKYAFRDGPSFWAGRPGVDQKIHIGIVDTTQLPVTQVILNQDRDCWTDAIDLEIMNATGNWEWLARVTGLRPGTNTIVLGRIQDSGPTVRGLFRFSDRRVLVAIDSYRDPELARTVRNALQQAAYPEHLRFSICHQYDDEVQHLLREWSDDPRFRIDTLPYGESKGRCWARARTFDRFDDEPYLLQISARTRFAPRWDARFIHMLESIDADLALLSTYPAVCRSELTGKTTYDLTSGLEKIEIKELRPDLTAVQRSRPVNADVSRPGPSPSIAADQIFTRGRFCRDVPYDAEIGSSGEELSLAARAFTNGYELRYPNETLLWRLNDPAYDVRMLEERNQVGPATETLGERLRTLFRENSKDLGPYGLGSRRSVRQFERVAGIRIRAGSASNDGVEIEIDRSAIPPRDDYSHFLVCFLDSSENEVARRIIRSPDVLDLSRGVVKFHGLEPNVAVSFTVEPVRHNGLAGTAVKTPLPALQKA